uniref:Immunoglobulin V-set domain-containing protein n=1 Tax=Cyprinodon variegatus TaxID=28743 RepID=A0A3Q2DUQ1_CYPVA
MVEDYNLLNCSHQHQPTLEVKTIGHATYIENFESLYPRFKFLRNQSSDSYDLLIINVTDSDEGLYYCGTFENKVEKEKNGNIVLKDVYVYGNISTRITLCKFSFLI